MLKRLPPVVLAVLIGGCSESTTSPQASGTTQGPRNNGSTGPRPTKSFATVPLTEFCAALAESVCHRRAVCTPTRVTSDYMDEAGCRRTQEADCEGEFVERIGQFLLDAQLIRFDANAMGVALTKYTRRHCNSTAPPPTLFDGVEGNVSEGDDCADNAMCVSNNCVRMNGRCGLCMPATNTPPTSCPSCDVGERCRCTTNDAGRSCQCVASLTEGAECTNDPNGCDEGLQCVNGRDPAGNPRNVCVADPGLGATCGPQTGLNACVGEAFCELLSGQAVGTCVAPEIVEVNQACDNVRRLCPFGHDCRGVCVPKAGAGERCIIRTAQQIPDGGPPSCSEGVCLQECRVDQPENMFCLEDEDCADNLGCHSRNAGSGVCSTWDTVRQRTENLFICP